MASLSKVSGFIRIRDAMYLLNRGQKLAIMGNMLLVDVTDGLFESPVASAVRFATAILLMVDLHAFF